MERNYNSGLRWSVRFSGNVHRVQPPIGASNQVTQHNDNSTGSSTKPRIRRTNREGVPLPGKKSIKRHTERFIIRKRYPNTGDEFNSSQGRFHNTSDAFPDNCIQSAVFGC